MGVGPLRVANDATESVEYSIVLIHVPDYHLEDMV